MKEKNHVMIDIETLGRKPGSIILSIAAVEFDLNGNIGETFYEHLNISESAKKGFILDPNTLKFWLNQDVEVFKEALKSSSMSISDVLMALRNFIRKNTGTYVWANSPSFDLALLESYYDAYEIPVPWFYTKEMDVRTISELQPEVRKKIKEEMGGLHLPIQDCLIQIKTVCQILKSK